MSAACSSLLDGFCLHGSTQINHVAKCQGGLLDLVLANEPRSYNVLEPIEPLTILDQVHPAALQVSV